MISPKQRVENVLLKRGVDKVPFTIYENLMPRCECERKLRNNGLCLVSGKNVYSVLMPNVKESSQGYFENGEYKTRWFLETPEGTLATVNVRKKHTTWSEEKIFKTPDDYKAIAFLIEDRMYKENYADFIGHQKEKGTDFICRTDIGYEPMQEIIISIMGVETFCMEWADNQDEVLKLYNLLVEDRRRRYKLAAQSPALIVQYGGNVSPEVVGLERFKNYYVPNYNEAAEELHNHGKLLGVHFDANNKLLAPEIAQAHLDYIDAFTPPPDCDMSVKEALEMWPNKILWINFPSSVHLAEEKIIGETTRNILKESIPGDRLIVGVTEDIPQNCYQKSLTVISEIINEEGALPLRKRKN